MDVAKQKSTSVAETRWIVTQMELPRKIEEMTSPSIQLS